MSDPDSIPVLNDVVPPPETSGDEAEAPSAWLDVEQLVQEVADCVSADMAAELDRRLQDFQSDLRQQLGERIREEMRRRLG